MAKNVDNISGTAADVLKRIFVTAEKAAAGEGGWGMEEKKYVGYACSYTPVQLIEAAGFTPYRILPDGDNPDAAGGILNDTICPHIKKILDRAIAGDTPPLAGTVFMNSCDAMRRLYDAWLRIRPDIPSMLIDLPATTGPAERSFFRGEIAAAADKLAGWSGHPVTDDSIHRAIGLYNKLAGHLVQLNALSLKGMPYLAAGEMQAIYNKAMTGPPSSAIDEIIETIKKPRENKTPPGRVPVYLFGNVMHDPEMLSMIESCGAGIIMNDTCTGGRMFTEIETGSGNDPLMDLASGLLKKPRCARTIDTANPAGIAESLANDAGKYGAKGVICHVMKFCDPYVLRLPLIREIAQRERIPILILEGDCTMRSMGQQRTRIEAFMEMLG